MAVVDEMLERIGLTGRGRADWSASSRMVSGNGSNSASCCRPTRRSILLDEPAAGMTQEEVLKTAELVREINRSKALIVVEHDMQFIRMIAKQVTVFNQGSVLVEDSVENIMRNPQVRDIYLGKQAAA